MFSLCFLFCETSLLSLNPILSFFANFPKLHYLCLCPQPSLASRLPVLLSCPLCGRGPQPRITVSVVEVVRPEQLRERCCCKGPGQGLLWASRLSWPDIPSLSERPCGRPVGVEADGHIPASPWTEASRTAPSVPSQLSISNVSRQTTLTKSEK